jgi:hypothetical protein
VAGAGADGKSAATATATHTLKADVQPVFTDPSAVRSMVAGLQVDAERGRLYVGHCSSGGLTVHSLLEGGGAPIAQLRPSSASIVTELALVDGVLLIADPLARRVHMLPVDSL